MRLNNTHMHAAEHLLVGLGQGGEQPRRRSSSTWRVQGVKALPAERYAQVPPWGPPLEGVAAPGQGKRPKSCCKSTPVAAFARQQALGGEKITRTPVNGAVAEMELPGLQACTTMESRAIHQALTGLSG